jgi:hypothetical protein
MVLIKYNKTRASAGGAFCIAYVLLLTMSRVLFQYLVYVYLFYNILQHQL